MPEPSITTAQGLRSTLIERAGFTGKRYKRQVAYDTNLIARLGCKIVPALSEPVERLIASQDVPVGAEACRIGFASGSVWRRHGNSARHEGGA